MFIVLTILLFVFTAVVMFILHVVRPRLSIQGLLVVLAVLAGLLMVILSRLSVPSTITLLNWSPDLLLQIEPTMRIDQISWLLAMALMSFTVAIVITSIALIGRSTKVNPTLAENGNQRIEAEPAEQQPGITLSEPGERMPNWLFWILALVLSGIGLLAVTAGNLLTVLLAWVAMDLIEVAILIGHTLKSESRERATIVFSAKLGGTLLLITAGLVLWSTKGSLDFTAIPSTARILIILAAAVRLGVLPPMIPHTHRIVLRQDLATMLYLVPASACCILLVRVASTGAVGKITPILVGLTTVIGMITAILWLTAADEIRGRQYWLVAGACLAVLSALLGQPAACLAWSIAILLSGGLVFSFSLRHRYLIPIVILGIFNLSTLPFSPTWQTASLFHSPQGITSVRVLDILFSMLFVFIQATLLAGFIRHLIRGFFSHDEGTSMHIEKWVWVLYPIGLVIIIIAHLLLGWYLLPDLRGLPYTDWIIGPLTLVTSVLIIYGTYRFVDLLNSMQQLADSSLFKGAFSNEWLFNLTWRVYRLVGRASNLLSTILEGDGGILWALVLFALIFVFLQR